jgi:hypothetical protein
MHQEACTRNRQTSRKGSGECQAKRSATLARFEQAAQRSSANEKARVLTQIQLPLKFVCTYYTFSFRPVSWHPRGQFRDSYRREKLRLHCPPAKRTEDPAKSLISPTSPECSGSPFFTFLLQLQVVMPSCRFCLMLSKSPRYPRSLSSWPFLIGHLTMPLSRITLFDMETWKGSNTHIAIVSFAWI